MARMGRCCGHGARLIAGANSPPRAEETMSRRADVSLQVNAMTALDASSVAALLREFGQRSTLRGGNPFRAKAYARAADNLLALSIPLETVIAHDRLQAIPGIGDAADRWSNSKCTKGPPRLAQPRRMPGGRRKIRSATSACCDGVTEAAWAPHSLSHGVSSLPDKSGCHSMVPGK